MKGVENDTISITLSKQSGCFLDTLFIFFLHIRIFTFNMRFCLTVNDSPNENIYVNIFIPEIFILKMNKLVIVNDSLHVTK